MTDFTPEQEAEIQKRIDAAKAEQKQLEQYRLAADQFYRLSLVHIESLAAQGACSPYVKEVGLDQYRVFLVRFFPQGAPAPEPETKGAADDEPEE
jgi:hypothetical protein